MRGNLDVFISVVENSIKNRVILTFLFLYEILPIIIFSFDTVDKETNPIFQGLNKASQHYYLEMINTKFQNQCFMTSNQTQLFDINSSNFDLAKGFCNYNTSLLFIQIALSATFYILLMLLSKLVQSSKNSDALKMALYPVVVGFNINFRTVILFGLGIYINGVLSIIFYPNQILGSQQLLAGFGIIFTILVSYIVFYEIVQHNYYLQGFPYQAKCIIRIRVTFLLQLLIAVSINLRKLNLVSYLQITNYTFLVLLLGVTVYDLRFNRIVSNYYFTFLQIGCLLFSSFLMIFSILNNLANIPNDNTVVISAELFANLVFTVSILYNKWTKDRLDYDFILQTSKMVEEKKIKEIIEGALCHTLDENINRKEVVNTNTNILNFHKLNCTLINCRICEVAFIYVQKRGKIEGYIDPSNPGYDKNIINYCMILILELLDKGEKPEKNIEYATVKIIGLVNLDSPNFNRALIEAVKLKDVSDDYFLQMGYFKIFLKRTSSELFRNYEMMNLEDKTLNIIMRQLNILKEVYFGIKVRNLKFESLQKESLVLGDCLSEVRANLLRLSKFSHIDNNNIFTRLLILYKTLYNQPFIKSASNSEDNIEIIEKFYRVNNILNLELDPITKVFLIRRVPTYPGLAGTFDRTDLNKRFFDFLPEVLRTSENDRVLDKIESGILGDKFSLYTYLEDKAKNINRYRLMMTFMHTLDNSIRYETKVDMTKDKAVIIIDSTGRIYNMSADACKMVSMRCDFNDINRQINIKNFFPQFDFQLMAHDQTILFKIKTGSNFLNNYFITINESIELQESIWIELNFIEKIEISNSDLYVYSFTRGKNKEKNTATGETGRAGADPNQSGNLELSMADLNDEQITGTINSGSSATVISEATKNKKKNLLAFNNDEKKFNQFMKNMNSLRVIYIYMIVIGLFISIVGLNFIPLVKSNMESIQSINEAANSCHSVTLFMINTILGTLTLTTLKNGSETVSMLNSTFTKYNFDPNFNVLKWIKAEIQNDVSSFDNYTKDCVIKIYNSLPSESTKQNSSIDVPFFWFYQNQSSNYSLERKPLLDTFKMLYYYVNTLISANSEFFQIDPINFATNSSYIDKIRNQDIRSPGTYLDISIATILINFFHSQLPSNNYIDNMLSDLQIASFDHFALLVNIFLFINLLYTSSTVVLILFLLKLYKQQVSIIMTLLSDISDETLLYLNKKLKYIQKLIELTKEPKIVFNKLKTIIKAHRNNVKDIKVVESANRPDILVKVIKKNRPLTFLDSSKMNNNIYAICFIICVVSAVIFVAFNTMLSSNLDSLKIAQSYNKNFIALNNKLLALHAYEKASLLMNKTNPSDDYFNQAISVTTYEQMATDIYTNLDIIYDMGRYVTDLPRYVTFFWTINGPAICASISNTYKTKVLANPDLYSQSADQISQTLFKICNQSDALKSDMFWVTPQVIAKGRDIIHSYANPPQDLNSIKAILDSDDIVQLDIITYMLYRPFVTDAQMTISYPTIIDKSASLLSTTYVIIILNVIFCWLVLLLIRAIVYYRLLRSMNDLKTFLNILS